MNKLIALLSIFISSPVWSEWSYVVSQESNGHEYYVDYTTIEFNEIHVYAWTMTDFIQEEDDGTESITALYEIRCDAPKQMRVISFQTYKNPMADGGLIKTIQPDPDFQYLIPGSVMDILVSTICLAN